MVEARRWIRSPKGNLTALLGLLLIVAIPVEGIGRIAGEPSRQRVGVTKVRQHDGPEARLIVVCYHAATRAPIPKFVCACCIP